MSSIPSTTTSTEEWRQYNILIVDDEEEILSAIQRDLILEGFHLFKAISVEAALQMLEKEEIHVMISDQKMPGGMKGTQLIAKAREKHPNIIGIVLSAYSEADHLLSAINDAHVFRYLLKPWDKSKLIECVTEALKFYHIKTLNHGGLEELAYTQYMFTEAVNKLAQHQDSLARFTSITHEAVNALIGISNATSQIAAGLKNSMPEVKSLDQL